MPGHSPNQKRNQQKKKTKNLFSQINVFSTKKKERKFKLLNLYIKKKTTPIRIKYKVKKKKN